jgi:hypothetical protein
MGTRTFTAPVRGIINLDITATALTLDVSTTKETKTRASVELTGPDDVISQVTSRTDGGMRWFLDVPGGPGDVAAGETVIGQVVHASGNATVFNIGGNAVFNNVVAGDLHVTQASSRHSPSGRFRVTKTSGIFQPYTTHATVCLPHASALTVRTTFGKIRVTGHLAELITRTTFADLVLSGSVGTLDAESSSADITATGLTGPVRARTSSGDIVLEQAAAPVNATSSSGDITVRVVEAIRVDAKTSSGDIRILYPPGKIPDVHARSSSGEVRFG